MQATEECRKQEELALKQKGQLADLSRQLESSSSEGSARSGAGAKAEEASEKQVREKERFGNDLIWTFASCTGPRDCGTEEQAADQRVQAGRNGARAEEGEGGARQVERCNSKIGVVCF